MLSISVIEFKSKRNADYMKIDLEFFQMPSYIDLYVLQVYGC